MGAGRGCGGMDRETGMAAGGVVTAGLAICFCSIGIPAILAGIIMLSVSAAGSAVWSVGLVLVIVSLLCLVCGIIIVIVLCTGCCGKKYNNNNNVGPTQISTMPPPVTQPVQPPSYSVATANPAPHLPQPGQARQAGHPFSQPAPSYPPVGAAPPPHNDPAYALPPPPAMYDAPPAGGYSSLPPPYS